MGDYQRVAGEEATVRCSAPGCHNHLTDTPFRMMSGAGEIHDFCNRTCLRHYMEGQR